MKVQILKVDKWNYRNRYMVKMSINGVVRRYSINRDVVKVLKHLLGGKKSCR
jgi:hypothetical protein